YVPKPVWHSINNTNVRHMDLSVTGGAMQGTQDPVVQELIRRDSSWKGGTQLLLPFRAKESRYCRCFRPSNEGLNSPPISEKGCGLLQATPSHLQQSSPTQRGQPIGRISQALLELK
ncbi:hypothetical protein GW17_00010529, partial [Ensete ventricosum]